MRALFYWVHRHTKLIISWNYDTSILFRWYHWLSCSCKCWKCFKLFLLRLRENVSNLNLYALTTGYISWAKVPFPISLVFSLFICLNNLTINAKLEKQSLLEYLVKPLYFSIVFKNCRICGFKIQTHVAGFMTFPKHRLNVKLGS